VFEDVIIFQLDKTPIISKSDMKDWKLHVKNDENWKVFGACKVLHSTVKLYSKVNDELTIERKKDEEEAGGGDERSRAIGLELRCENLKTRT